MGFWLCARRVIEELNVNKTTKKALPKCCSNALIGRKRRNAQKEKRLTSLNPFAE